MPGPPPSPSRSGPPEPTFARTTRQAARADDLAVFEEVVRHRDNPVFAIIDRRALGDLVEHFDAISEAERNQAYGALTAAIWMSGQEIPLPHPT